MRIATIHYNIHNKRYMSRGNLLKFSVASAHLFFPFSDGLNFNNEQSSVVLLSFCCGLVIYDNSVFAWPTMKIIQNCFMLG